MAQWTLTKVQGSCYITRTHMVEKGLTLTSCPLTPLMHYGVCTPIHMQTESRSKNVFRKKERKKEKKQYPCLF